MNIVFMGTPEFAVPCLEILLNNHYKIAAVVTAPDKPAGRGRQINESAVKTAAAKHGLKILQPVNLKDEQFEKELRELNADLQIVVAFRMLPEKIWNMPRLGTYNVHASLLPQFRGAAPINRAIMAGATESGVSTFKLQHQIDTGNILFQQVVPIAENENAGDLYNKLMYAGAELLLKTVRAIEEHDTNGSALEFKIQDERYVSHAPKIFKEDCRIDWSKKAEEIRNQIRGLSPYPGAYSVLQNGEKDFNVKIFNAVAVEEKKNIPNGSQYTDNKNFIRIKCADAFLEITELQIEGKKRMSAAEFLRGFQIAEAAVFK